MSDVVEVPFGDEPAETATLLLAAAEKLSSDQSLVRTTGHATFVVPREVADEAGVDYESGDEDDEQRKPTRKSAKK